MNKFAQGTSIPGTTDMQSTLEKILYPLTGAWGDVTNAWAKAHSSKELNEHLEKRSNEIKGYILKNKVLSDSIKTKLLSDSIKTKLGAEIAGHEDLFNRVFYTLDLSKIMDSIEKNVDNSLTLLYSFKTMPGLTQEEKSFIDTLCEMIEETYKTAGEKKEAEDKRNTSSSSQANLWEF